MAKDKKYKYHLTELRKSDFEIANGEPDIRGWKVKNLQGQVLGEVVELLFDPLSRSVRYLIVHIEGKALHLISRNVLIPIGLADLHEDVDDVILPNVTVGHLATLPTYKRDTITPTVERSIRGIFSGEPAPVITDVELDNIDDRERFYEHEYFNDDKLYSKRRQKRTITDNQPEATTRTTRHIIQKPVGAADEYFERPTDQYGNKYTPDPENAHRHPVDQPVLKKFEPFKEGAIEFTEHAEVPVVSKETRVIEEVRVNKEIEHRDELIRDKIRRTEVDVEEFDNEGRRR